MAMGMRLRMRMMMRIKINNLRLQTFEQVVKVMSPCNLIKKTALASALASAAQNSLHFRVQ